MPYPLTEMSDRPEQKTEKTPKGATVPVPRRDDFLANLKKVAKVGVKPTSDGRTQK